MGNLVSWHPGKEPLKRQVFPIDLNLGLCFKLDFSHHLEKKIKEKYEFLAILWQIEIFRKKILNCHFCLIYHNFMIFHSLYKIKLYEKKKKSIKI